MENKSLNVCLNLHTLFFSKYIRSIPWGYVFFLFIFWQIFNSKLVLASPETASDADYAAILGVIGHEVGRLFWGWAIELLLDLEVTSYCANFVANWLHVCICSIFTTGLETG